MGIRFYCPNGHRLNVKDFLAGKHGICPKCEARFRIPGESQIAKDSPRIQPGSAAEEELSRNIHLRNGDNGNSVATATQRSGTSARAKTTENLFDSQDPIDAAPDAMWYVRPPTGGQYGPARGEVLRRWIAEGRVSADSLVWREGWDDWKVAGPLFPTLTAQQLPKKIDLPGGQAPTPKGILTPSPSIPLPAKAITKRKSMGLAVALILLIVALSAGIAIVLILKS